MLLKIKCIFIYLFIYGLKTYWTTKRQFKLSIIEDFYFLKWLNINRKTMFVFYNFTAQNPDFFLENSFPWDLDCW